jgi:hypothetical protein
MSLSLRWPLVGRHSTFDTFDTFFGPEKTEQPEHMASLRNRRRYFSEWAAFKRWSRRMIKCIASAARTL